MSQPRWMTLAKKAVGTYAGHPLFEDLLSEVYLAAWSVTERYPDADADRQGRLVWATSQKAACEFLRSPRNLYREHTRHGQAVPQWVSLSEWQGSQGDFVPALLIRLEIEAAAARLDVTERDWRIFRLVALQGFNYFEVGRQYQITFQRIAQIHAEIQARLRQEAGIVVEGESTYRGVYPVPTGYRCQVRHQGRTYSLRTWPTQEEAALVVDAAVIAFDLKGPLNLLPESCR